MKRVLVALLLTVVSAVSLRADQPLHLGEFQSIRATAVTYDAFIPENYNPATRWPLILIASDDAKLIARFSPAASKYGYVVAQSATADAHAAWADARHRFRANASRSYLILAGTSAASVNFSDLPDVSGLAAINVVPRNLDAPTLFFSFGNLHTSYIELKQLAKMTSEQRRRVGSDTFGGTELAAEAATRIVEWFHLDALDQGIAVVTDDHVASIVSSWTSTAQALESTDPLRAVSMYNAIVANFSAVTAQARQRSNQVASSLAYSRAEYAEGRAVRWEAAQKKRIVETSRSAPATPEAYLKKLDMAAVRAKINGKDGAMKNAAIRVVRYASETAGEQSALAKGARQEFWRAVLMHLHAIEGDE
jgi:hypothetical protein